MRLSHCWQWDVISNDFDNFLPFCLLWLVFSFLFASSSGFMQSWFQNFKSQEAEKKNSSQKYKKRTLNFSNFKPHLVLLKQG